MKGLGIENDLWNEINNNLKINLLLYKSVPPNSRICQTRRRAKKRTPKKIPRSRFASFLKLQPHQNPLSMNRLSHLPRTSPRILKPLIRYSPRIHSFTMSANPPSPSQTSPPSTQPSAYKPRYIDVHPPPPPSPSPSPSFPRSRRFYSWQSRRANKRNTVDRHKPHRPRLYGPLPLHATSPLRPPIRHLPRPRCRL